MAQLLLQSQQPSLPSPPDPETSCLTEQVKPVQPPGAPVLTHLLQALLSGAQGREMLWEIASALYRACVWMVLSKCDKELMMSVRSAAAISLLTGHDRDL